MFVSVPLTAKQIARERRRADLAGLSFTVTDTVTREDVEDAAPKSLTVSMQARAYPGGTQRIDGGQGANLHKKDGGYDRQN